jgi:predicted MarR family transcription regulator
MFTIEHDFDATIITLVDEGSPHLQEDVVIMAFEDCVTLEQIDPRTDEVLKITLSQAQVRELAAALNLPEGVYRLTARSAAG